MRVARSSDGKTRVDLAGALAHVLPGGIQVETVVLADREQAGEALADALEARFAHDSRVLVLALPRGGVPVARVVAKRLDAPFDVFMVRRLPVPSLR